MPTTRVVERERQDVEDAVANTVRPVRPRWGRGKTLAAIAELAAVKVGEVRGVECSRRAAPGARRITAGESEGGDRCRVFAE
jgi:hypothetical protein